jgi:3'(2'), 5'-bisphosphate nucleotidase
MAIMFTDWAAEGRVASDLALLAGKAILEVYSTRFEVSFKGPDDPATDADKRAQDIIVEGLSREFPHDGIVSEECPISEEARRKPRVWYVDPLDGTGEYVAHTGEFSVIIGLLKEGLPKFGEIYRPVGDVLYAGACDEATWIITGADCRRAWVSTAVPTHLILLAVSRSHRHPIIDRIKARLGNVIEISCGSVGAKIGLLVSGKADAYVEPSPYTSKWDVCGVEAILLGASGLMSDMTGGPIRYEGAELKNTRGFVSTNRMCQGEVLAASRHQHSETRLPAESVMGTSKF